MKNLRLNSKILPKIKIDKYRSIKKSIEYGFARNKEQTHAILKDIESHDYHADDPRLHEHIRVYRAPKLG